MVSEWDDPVVAKPIRYQNIDFDSRLELNWYLSLERYGADVWWHPGRIELKSGGWWEPDARVGGVLCEVKPHQGTSTDRLWKPYAAADEYQLPVLILRPGIVPDDPTIERAGLDWESTDSSIWVIVRSPAGTAKFVREPEIGEEVDRRYVHYAASLVVLNPGLTGLEMAHWSEAR